MPSVLGWKGAGALLVARDEPGEIVLGSWLVADWFTRGWHAAGNVDLRGRV